MTEAQYNLIEKARLSLNLARNLLDMGYTRSSAMKVCLAMQLVAQAFLLVDGIPAGDEAATLSSFADLALRRDDVPAQFPIYLSEALQLKQRLDHGEMQDVTAEVIEKHIERGKKLYEAAQRL